MSIDRIIQEICIPAIRSELNSGTAKPRPSFAAAVLTLHARGGYRDAIAQATRDWHVAIEALGPVAGSFDDLLARVAIDALTPGRAVLFVRADCPEDFDVLADLLALACSPEIKSDLLDSIEAVLDELDELDTVAAAVRDAGIRYGRLARAAQVRNGWTWTK